MEAASSLRCRARWDSAASASGISAACLTTGPWHCNLTLRHHSAPPWAGSCRLEAPAGTATVGSVGWSSVSLCRSCWAVAVESWDTRGGDGGELLGRQGGGERDLAGHPGSTVGGATHRSVTLSIPSSLRASTGTVSGATSCGTGTAARKAGAASSGRLGERGGIAMADCCRGPGAGAEAL